MKGEARQQPLSSSASVRNTMLTCLWERSLNTALELLPSGLLCHCLFLPWKILKIPTLESLLQKVIRWQTVRYISTVIMSESILDLRVSTLPQRPQLVRALSSPTFSSSAQN